jgi:hypothetical protein
MLAYLSDCLIFLLFFKGSCNRGLSKHFEADRNKDVCQRVLGLFGAWQDNRLQKKSNSKRNV